VARVVLAFSLLVKTTALETQQPPNQDR